MRTKLVADGDILYVELREGKVHQTLEPYPLIHVDVDSEGRVLAIEVVGVHEVPIETLLGVFDQFGVVLAPRDMLKAS